ncbi:MAG TPA: hypothetical protein VFS10_00150 [Pyrinomonadaceae bacterium]|nr:hypothetical protein [Pyrinomonadaceae bacterium]
MPALRSSLRRLVLAASVCLASVSSLLHPVTTPPASACPISPPTPLRMLYQKSERVVVARAGHSEPDKTSNDDSYRRTTFHIGESLKGGHGESTLQVVHYTNPETPEFVGNFKKGDRLLLFLNYDDGQNAYRVNDMRHGAKKLSDEDLKIYLRRIEELSAILLKDKPDEQEIVEWLVRCAEEPATRWEGAYELYAGYSMARDEANAAAGNNNSEAAAEEEANEEGEAEEQALEEEEATEAVGPAVETEEVVETETLAEVPLSVEANAGEGETTEVQQINLTLFRRVDMYGTDIAPESVAALTPDQKTRLANALFRADKIGEGETTLLEIVKGWGDERLVPFLNNHLRNLEKDPPYFATELMSVLAETLKDKTLERLVENYMSNAPYEDYFEGEVSDESGDEEEEEASENESRASVEEKKKVSAVQKRSEMLREFLNAAENRIHYNLAMQLSR